MTGATESAHFSHLSLLDHLRPPAGWRTDCAVISTYSAQTSVIAAVLLALGGMDDIAGSGSKVGLARVLKDLRGKVHFVLQAGRLTLSKRPAQVVSLLDRFVLQVPWDEGSNGLRAGRSWHAKFALVRQLPEVHHEQGERWVFLLGSRNLTMDMSWDIGLVFKAGSQDTRGKNLVSQSVSGVASVAADLAILFPNELSRWTVLAKMLKKVQWQLPAGMDVAELRLLMPDTPGRAMPLPSAKVHRLLAVSPFLDSGAVREIAGWGDESTLRQLLSTRPALKQLAQGGNHGLGHFDQLLALPAPQHEITLGDPLNDEENQVASDQIGLHAKIIFAEHSQGCTFWLGSPNLTQRAWKRNAECYARIDMRGTRNEVGQMVQAGMIAFVDMAEVVSLTSLDGSPEDITLEQRLAEARVQVAARLSGATQSSLGDDVLVVRAVGLPHPDDSDIRLFCGPLISEPQLWQRGVPTLELSGAAAMIARSDCLRVRLAIGEVDVEWVQMVSWNPPLDEGRDDAVLSDYLGPRQFSSWISDVLNGYTDGDEGGAWDGPRTRPAVSRKGASTIAGLPSIDQALRMWLRDKSQLDEVDRILQIWSHRLAMPNRIADDADFEVASHLQSFSRSWQALRKGLRRDAP